MSADLFTAKKSDRKYTASHILSALRQKHIEDVFVPECKDGSTQARSTHKKMDAWVMPRSWSKPHITGYEIKVTRGDFLGDRKWQGYLEMCNTLYFAAAPGIIHPNELPAEVGLMEAVGWGTGMRLITRKKAVCRTDQKIPESVFRYVLMCRATIGVDREMGARERAQQFLDEKEEDKALGLAVSRKTREMMRKLNRESQETRALCESYGSIIAYLQSAGIDHTSPYVGTIVRNKVKAQQEVFTQQIQYQVSMLRKGLEQMEKRMEEINKGA